LHGGIYELLIELKIRFEMCFIETELSKIHFTFQSLNLGRTTNFSGLLLTWN